MLYRKYYEGSQMTPMDLDVGSSILKLYDSDVFSRSVKVYYGLDKHHVAENKIQDSDRSDFLKRVYKIFPYCYQDKRDPQNNDNICEYYTFQDSIDRDILQLLELKKIREYSWNVLDPDIATRLLTSYVKTSYDLNSILTSHRNIKVKLEDDRDIHIPVTQKFEIRTIGYDHVQGEITLGIMRRLNIGAVPLYSLDERNFWYVIRTLKSLVEESVKNEQRVVRIYSGTQPNLKTATVVDIILGSRSVRRFLERHPKGTIYIEKKLKELGRSLKDVKCLLIGVYNNKVPLKRAKNDDRYQYYFTEYNTYLVLTPKIQKELFKRFCDSWRISVIDEYRKKLKEIANLGNFRYFEKVKGIPVDPREKLKVRTYRGIYTVERAYDIFKDHILSTMLPISKNILEKTKKHKLQITVFCPEKYSRKIYQTPFYRGLDQFREGLFSNTFASVDDINVVPVKGEDPEDYKDVMEDVGFDNVQDYTLGVIIFPERYIKRDLNLKKFYNKLKERFYSENKPLVFQGAKVDTIFNERYNRYASYNLLLQIPPKLGIYIYSLEKHLEYNYIAGIDYTYWYEGDTVSLGGGAVIVSPSGVIEDIHPVVIPSNTESLDMTKILIEWFNIIIKKKGDILDDDKITLLILRDGRIPKYERETIQEFLTELSGDIDIKVEAVEIRKRIAVRTWSSQKVSYYTPVKVGNYTHYLVDAHIGYSLKDSGVYYSTPYLIGNYYSFERSRSTPTFTNPGIHIVQSLIHLQKINYGTTKMDNVKLPLPLSITHKLIEFIRDTQMKIKKIGIPRSLFMI